MKKLFALSLMLVTSIIVLPSAGAANVSRSVGSDPQIRVDIGPRRYRRWNRRPQTVIRTRITRIGRYRYRETLRITYLPNGRTRTRVISRVRLGRAW